MEWQRIPQKYGTEPFALGVSPWLEVKVFWSTTHIPGGPAGWKISIGGKIGKKLYDEVEEAKGEAEATLRAVCQKTLEALGNIKSK